MSTNLGCRRRRASGADELVEAGVEGVHLIAAVALHRLPVRPASTGGGATKMRRRRRRRACPWPARRLMEIGQRAALLDERVVSGEVDDLVCCVPRAPFGYIYGSLPGRVFLLLQW